MGCPHFSRVIGLALFIQVVLVSIDRTLNARFPLSHLPLFQVSVGSIIVGLQWLVLFPSYVAHLPLFALTMFMSHMVSSSAMARPIPPYSCSVCSVAAPSPKISGVTKCVLCVAGRVHELRSDLAVCAGVSSTGLHILGWRVVLWRYLFPLDKKWRSAFSFHTIHCSSVA